MSQVIPLVHFSLLANQWAPSICVHEIQPITVNEYFESRVLLFQLYNKKYYVNNNFNLYFSNGDQCCTNKETGRSMTYSKRKSICCGGEIFNKRTYSCCDGKPLKKAKSFCCRKDAKAWIIINL